VGQLILQIGADQENHAWFLEAVRLLRQMRRMHLSIRSLYKLPRTITRAQLDGARKDLEAYRPKTVCVARKDTHGQRVACGVPLREVVDAQLELARLEGGVQCKGKDIWIVVCPDGTPFWRASATRCDVYVDIWDRNTYAPAGLPRRWSVWWIMDGDDDTEGILEVDRRLDLNGQVEDMEGYPLVGEAGECRTPLVFYTGDGKGMTNANHCKGLRCWLCDIKHKQWHTVLEPSDDVPEYARLAATQKHIPPIRRIGDYAHCCGRVANGVVRRLAAMGGRLKDRKYGRKIQEVVYALNKEAEGLPRAERVAPRPTKIGTLSLTTARLLCEQIHYGVAIVDLVREASTVYWVEMNGTRVKVWVPVAAIFRSLFLLHRGWRTKTPFTDAEVRTYVGAVEQFGHAWKALGWTVPTWVHWTIRHSALVAKTWRNFYVFSSIPTERRHQEFKMDVRHCFQGWKLSKPYLTWRGLVHVLRLAALDVGLQQWAMRRRNSGLKLLRWEVRW
jgi:hypothetical protein